MRRWIPVAVALMLAAATAALIAGGARTTREAATRPRDAGGNGPPPREEPHRVTPGEYRAPVFTAPGAEERGQRAQAADLARPPFEGVVNGIYLWSETPPADPSLGAKPCPDDRTRQVPESEQSASPYYVEVPSYLPPGAYEVQEPEMLACDTGQVVHVGRVVELRPSGIEIGVSREVGRWAAPIGHAHASRVEEGAVGGKPAAFVRPVTKEGFGTSWIYIREDFGVTGVTAFDLPFEELLEVAEAVVRDDAS